MRLEKKERNEIFPIYITSLVENPTMKSSPNPHSQNYKNKTPTPTLRNKKLGLKPNTL